MTASRERSRATSVRDKPRAPARSAATRVAGSAVASDQEPGRRETCPAAPPSPALASSHNPEDSVRQQRTPALLIAETRLRLVMEAANIGLWDWDISQNTVYHSPEWKRQLGYADDEITNNINEWQSRLHPDDRLRVQTVVDEFVREPRSSYDLEFRLQHRNGSYRWIHSQGRLVLEDGKPVRMVGIHQDITASKEREKALVESEQRYRRLVESTPIIPWEAEPESWRFTYVAPRASRILGYPAEDWLLEAFWLSHLHPDDATTAPAFRGEQCRRKDDFDAEYRMLAADGRVVWFHDVVHVVRGPDGPERLQGFLIDISEQRRAAEEHGRLAAIVESSNDAIIGETLEGRITSWNKSAERIYGYTASEALGRPIGILVPREREHEVTDILRRIRAGEIIDHFETIRVRKDGQHIHVSLVVSPIRDALGQIIGASAIARDITERKQLEAEVLQISEREQQRIARDLHDGLGQSLSGTVHLANVLQMELAEQALPEAAEALRITELLNQAVAETRCLARGLYPVPPEANGLTVALQELASRTKDLFKVRCSVRCRQAVLVRDNAIATHLYRIAQEAINNALKHGQAQAIEIGLSANKERILLTVRDDGVGLAEAFSSRKGMGIRTMRYRAGMIGGSLAIENALPCGVRVVCTVRRLSAHKPRPKRP